MMIRPCYWEGGSVKYITLMEFRSSGIRVSPLIDISNLILNALIKLLTLFFLRIDLPRP